MIQDNYTPLQNTKSQLYYSHCHSVNLKKHTHSNNTNNTNNNNNGSNLKQSKTTMGWYGEWYVSSLKRLHLDHLHPFESKALSGTRQSH